MIKKMVEVVYNRDFNVAQPISIFENLFQKRLKENELKVLLNENFPEAFTKEILVFITKDVLLPRDIEDILELIFVALL